MTGELLHTYSRKRLAAMARSRQVSGWHDMRKADLIQALLDEELQQPSVPRRNGASLDRRDASPVRQNAAPDRNGASSRGTSRRLPKILLSTADAAADRLSAALVGPHWIRVEWAVTRETLLRAECALGPARHQARPILRLYDLSDDERLTHAVTHVSDVPIAADAEEWFVQVPQPEGTYQLQLGILAAAGRFHRLVTSEHFRTDDPVHRSVASALQRVPARSRHLARSADDPSQRHGLPLSIDVELVIRGRTLPHASVSILDDQVSANSEGVFEAALPTVEGRQVIPATVIGPEQRMRRTVVVALQRHTRFLGPQGPKDR